MKIIHETDKGEVVGTFDPAPLIEQLGTDDPAALMKHILENSNIAPADPIGKDE